MTMQVATPAARPLAVAPEPRPRRRRLMRSRSAELGLVLVMLIVLAAVFAPLLSPFGYTDTAFDHTLQPPFWLPGGSLVHPLGTDQLGRDLWSRLVYGARTSLLVGVGAVALAGTIGVTAGVVAGYAGGWLDDLVGRAADLQLAFPPVFLAIAIMGVIGQSLLNLVLVLGLVSWVQYARVARGSTLAIKQLEYVDAARTLGAHTARVLMRHVGPNVMPPIAAIATVSVSTMIMAEAGLSFLGLGVQPPTPAWGSMLAETRDAWAVAPWSAVFPGLAIFLTVLGINLLGSGLIGED
jgi:peptide/nickel transport system permease protein